jgi:hypothetical protein
VAEAVNQLTPGQEYARDARRESMHDTTVPKSLRNAALQLVRTIPNVDRRTHASSWVRHASRLRPELESFIERMKGMGK